jgi:hypothetical protein
MQSGWHSVPAPFGLEQGTGPQFAAAVEHAPTPEDPRLVLGLGRAYGLGTASSWTRSASLEKASLPAAARGEETARVVIEDRWNLSAPNEDPKTARRGDGTATPNGQARTPDVDIHYLLSGTVELAQEGMATVRPEGIPDTDGGRGALLRWDAAAAVVHVDEWLLEDPLLAEMWGTRLTRLRFRMPRTMRADGSFTLTVEANNES